MLERYASNSITLSEISGRSIVLNSLIFKPRSGGAFLQMPIRYTHLRAEDLVEKNAKNALSDYNVLVAVVRVADHISVNQSKT